jgi:hypothetical protein
MTARTTIALHAATGMIMALVLALAAIATPMAAAQTTEEEDGVEGNQTTTAFFPEDDQSRRLSILGALGASVVEGVKVTGVALNEDGSEVTVTLSSADNSTTNATTTTPAVTVAAFKTQLDLAGLLQGQMMMHQGQGTMPHTMPGGGEAQGQMMMQNYSAMNSSNSSGMPMFDTKSFLENLEVGSNIEQEGWESPAELIVPVISGNNTTTNATTANNMTTPTTDTEVVIVAVIPFTGETRLAEASASTEEEEGQAQTNDTTSSTS